jgi:shikimate kinase/3-dehydroquinate synthase
VDVVLVGLPGSGKSVVGRRIAHRHRAEFIDLDETIERTAGRRIPDIFEAEGEAAFRALEAQAVADLGPADSEPDIRRVVATGGGTPVDPRNRWRLYRDRLVIWLDARPEALAQRLRRSRNVRPLIAGRDPVGAVRLLAAARERFYAPGHRVNSLAEPQAIADSIETLAAGAAREPGSARGPGARLLDADTRIGRIVIGESIAASALAEVLERLEAPRAIVVSEPGAWEAFGASVVGQLRSRGLTVETVSMPRGEAAKRLSVIEAAARELARLRVERREPLVCIGGGALGDAGGLLAALWLRGVPLIHVPTTLVAQIDSSIGGKTAVDLPEGKNLVGAFHQPAAVVIDVAALRTLPDRQRRAALGEAVKMAALGDERLFRLLESDGEAIAAGKAGVFESGAHAELVERCAWAKVDVVLADERESQATAGRVTLNLGHSAGHAFETAGGFESLLHGEAVAYGLRVASRLGVALGTTPPERAQRIERLLDGVGLGREPLAFGLDQVLEALGLDKKHAGGHLRWVIPTETGVEVRSDVPEALVRDAIGSVLAVPAKAG